jgi:regulator of protease activity HflC (stomatin/prohibitin superfamily)
MQATSQLAQTTLRAILGKHELDQLLAERERRAKVIHDEGELQASAKLLEAAHVLAQAPQAMQLRYLQTLTAIAGEKSSTIVFPMPVDLMAALMDRAAALKSGLSD